jgi:regulator of protease activity HflC (stomatin/prohibitin superfamily)
MLLLKYLLLVAGVGMLAGAAAIVAYDIYLAAQFRRLLFRGTAPPAPSGEEPARPVRLVRPVRWSTAGKLTGLALLPLLLSLSIVVVPDGSGGVRVSQISGARPGTLYPGVHLVVPLIERVVVYDLRDHVFMTAAAEDPRKKAEVLKVQGREGLSIGVAIVVRYRLDPRRLDFIHANLPQPIEEEIVAPVVATVFRQTAPNYIVREIFATRREELRNRAAEAITTRLAADGIVVKEVMLRDIQLPPEYARGLEGLLLKEQENERLGTETEIKQKQVRIAELEAEAQKAREIKQAEAAAQTRVLSAKAESDAMQYTLPLKQKQIEQTRLESEARKEATVKNAEAAAAAKVIDSKAEFERRNLLADAEASRIRITAAADAERMKLEALVLKQNPLLIQKIIAERLSDKLQIMMVPIDGKNFFANDVLRSAFNSKAATESVDPEDESGDAPGPNGAARRKPNTRP